ncbi:YqhR family membrane protein [Virgibacillus ndiopensis]|uniref:YqhR family membrane protein n=1 Tax=Virgibacillus ndiopensis TaxID=2004408 RepID=UPI000C06D02C|nr:YqhR family membrane protein [Virgibacillus ndiopensis]
MSEDRQLEQNKREKPMTLVTRSLITGFIGGLLWSLLGFVMYYFSFSEVAPKTFLLRSWLVAEWTDSWLGNVVSILMVGVLSILTAFIYYGLFKKINSMWMASAFGIVLWFIVFYVAQPIFINVPQLTELSANTIISTLCLFILYGTFIGYSISYDYHDTILTEERKQTE